MTMSRCPSCGQETRRTIDWACLWCGYPLTSGSYKQIDKSYRTLLEERWPLPEPEPEFETTSEPATPEPEPTPEITPQAPAETEPAVTAEPEPEFEMASEPVTPEPEPTSETTPQAPAETEPAVTAEPEMAGKKPKTSRRKASPSKPTGSEPTITVEQLFADYKANAVAADARYQGQTIQIAGIVDSIDNDMLDNPFVKLSSVDKNEMLRMRCTFPKESEERLLKLTAGQEITVRGSYDGYLVNILLKDCVLVEE